MATFTNFLAKQTPYPHLTPLTKTLPMPSHFSLPIPSPSKPNQTLTRRSSATAVRTSTSAAPEKVRRDERVQKVHNMEEFDEALRKANNRLVVVEYAARGSDDSIQIYPFMVDLSRNCSDVDFLLVMEDESEATRA